MSNQDNGVTVNFVADFDGDIRQLTDIEIPDEMPVLPLRNMVLFPSIMTPVNIGRTNSRKVIKKAEKQDMLIAVF